MARVAAGVLLGIGGATAYYLTREGNWNRAEWSARNFDASKGKTVPQGAEVPHGSPTGVSDAEVVSGIGRGLRNTWNTSITETASWLIERVGGTTTSSSPAQDKEE